MNLLQNKLEKIKADLQTVINIIDGFKSYDEIPNVDIDLLKQNILVSYEDIIRLNDKTTETKAETIAEEVEEDDLEPEIEVKFIETVEDAPEEVKEFYKQETIETKPEPVLETKEEPAKEVIEEIEEVVKKKTVEIDESIKSPLVTIFKDFSTSEDLASRLQFQAITDVNKAISINDKIGFIRDIFEGNNEKFTSCLNGINKAENISSVITELDNKIDWDKENPVHITFLELVYRKFL